MNRTVIAALLLVVFITSCSDMLVNQVDPVETEKVVSSESQAQAESTDVIDKLDDVTGSLNEIEEIVG